MSYISLYRRFRPVTFQEMIGQDHIVRTLTNQIKSGNIGHAYLFTGTRGTGKTTAAKIFARAVNCINPLEGSPCQRCDTCIDLNTSNNIDILEIDAASNNGVDEIREIRDKVKYPPSAGKYKVYIIDEVHMLTTGAFNALLKTLEEPPEHIIFILATTEVHKLPQTILSRCMRFDFRLVPTDLIAVLIKNVYDELKNPYEKEAITAIAVAGEGSVRDALSIADMCMSFKEGKITYKDVNEVIGASSPFVVASVIEAVLCSDIPTLFNVIDECSRFGRNFSILGRDISNMLRNLIYINNSTEYKSLNLPEDILYKMKAIAEKYDSVRILTVLESLIKLEGAMRYSIQPRIAFEAGLIRAAICGNELNQDALARIKVLEDRIANISTSLNKTQCVQSALTKVPESDIQEENKAASIDIEDKEITEEINKNDTVLNNVLIQDVTLIATDEEAVFNEVQRPRSDSDPAKDIMGDILRALRRRNLFDVLGIFGYNEVNVRIEDDSFYIDTLDEFAYNKLTEEKNNKILIEELTQLSSGKLTKLIIIPPKQEVDINKSIKEIKNLFQSDILNIKK